MCEDQSMSDQSKKNMTHLYVGVGSKKKKKRFLGMERSMVIIRSPLRHY